jgi:hypothetical protein
VEMVTLWLIIGVTFQKTITFIVIVVRTSYLIEERILFAEFWTDVAIHINGFAQKEKEHTKSMRAYTSICETSCI